MDVDFRSSGWSANKATNDSLEDKGDRRLTGGGLATKCSCGYVFLDDAAFCRSSGRRREASGSEDSFAPSHEKRLGEKELSNHFPHTMVLYIHLKNLPIS